MMRRTVRAAAAAAVAAAWLGLAAGPAGAQVALGESVGVVGADPPLERVLLRSTGTEVSVERVASDALDGAALSAYTHLIAGTDTFAALGAAGQARLFAFAGTGGTLVLAGEDARGLLPAAWRPGPGDVRSAAVGRGRVVAASTPLSGEDWTQDGRLWAKVLRPAGVPLWPGSPEDERLYAEPQAPGLSADAVSRLRGFVPEGGGSVPAVALAYSIAAALAVAAVLVLRRAHLVPAAAGATAVVFAVVAVTVGGPDASAAPRQAAGVLAALPGADERGAVVVALNRGATDAPSLPDAPEGWRVVAGDPTAALRPGEAATMTIEQTVPSGRRTSGALRLTSRGWAGRVRNTTAVPIGGAYVVAPGLERGTLAVTAVGDLEPGETADVALTEPEQTDLVSAIAAVAAGRPGGAALVRAAIDRAGGAGAGRAVLIGHAGLPALGLEGLAGDGPVVVAAPLDVVSDRIADVAVRRELVDVDLASTTRRLTVRFDVPGTERLTQLRIGPGLRGLFDEPPGIELWDFLEQQWSAVPPVGESFEFRPDTGLQRFLSLDFEVMMRVTGPRSIPYNPAGAWLEAA